MRRRILSGIALGTAVVVAEGLRPIGFKPRQKVQLVRSVFYDPTLTYDEVNKMSAKWLNRDYLARLDMEFITAGHILNLEQQSSVGMFSVVRVFSDQKSAMLWEAHVAANSIRDIKAYLRSGILFISTKAPI